MTSGTKPSAGGGVHSREPREDLLAPRDAGRPVDRAARRRAARPRQPEVGERLVHLVDVEVEDVVGALEEAVLGHDRADLAHLVEEQRRAPVLDEELVPLGVREDVAAEAEHLLERLPLLVGAEQLRVLGRDPVALGQQPLLGPVEARARVDLRDVARDRRERQAEVVDPRAMVVVEAVARRHEEPRVLARLEVRDPGRASLALLELGQHFRGRTAVGERAVDAVRDAPRWPGP